MNIDFNEIVQQKLAQMEAEGVIQKKIEDTLEKSIGTSGTIWAKMRWLQLLTTATSRRFGAWTEAWL